MRLYRWIEGREAVAAEPDAAEREALGDPRVSDAPSVLILPALWDHHGHVASLGALLEQVDLRGIPSAAASVEKARAAARALPPGDWVEGFGWDQNLWGGTYPHRRDLDAAFPDHPVLLRRIDGHAAWVNSAALRVAGFDDATPDPPGGALLREDGSSTGILLDTAMEAVADHIPRPSRDTLRRRLLAGLRHLAGCGLSGVTDMGLEADAIRVLLELDRDRLLPIPVEGFAWVRPGEEALPDAVNGERFRVIGVKLFADGALGSRGAALRESYTDAPSERGLLLWDDGDLERVLRACAERGLEVAVHAIGDRAAGQVLEAVARSRSRGVRLEHAQVLSAEDVARMGALGVSAGVQPCHYLSDREWAPRRLGERMTVAYRWKSLLDAGVRLRLGTDFPIEPPDPGRTFRACFDRPDVSERLTPAQALEASSPPRWARAFCGGTLAACDTPEEFLRSAEARAFLRVNPGTGPC